MRSHSLAELGEDCGASIAFGSFTETKALWPPGASEAVLKETCKGMQAPGRVEHGHAGAMDSTSQFALVESRRFNEPSPAL